MKEILEELQRQYAKTHSEEINLAIEINLAQQGIDPFKVPKRDLDQIRRLNLKLEEVKGKADQKINKVVNEVSQEANKEMLEIHNELAKINQKIRKEQGIEAIKEETTEGIKDGPTPGAESGPDNSAAPESDSPVVQEH